MVYPSLLFTNPVTLSKLLGLSNPPVLSIDETQIIKVPTWQGWYED